MKQRPLEGVRVLNLGGIWAGRVAAMLLADQGADVIEINRPGHGEELYDAALARGKRTIEADLNNPKIRADIRRLAEQCDIVFDNLGPGRATLFELDDASLRPHNDALVYVSMPGFAEGSEWDGVRASEGTIAASVGVYTDIHALGPIMGGPPIFSSVPMASAYAGVHAAIAANMAFLDRLKTGTGRRIEVALADALMSAMALLIMKVDGQPQRFDLPPIDKAMSEVAFPIFRSLTDQIGDEQRGTLQTYLARFARPQFGNYECSDGKLVFINAVDHVRHARSCLEALGILDDLLAEGMVVGSPYEEDGDGNNISYSAGLSARWSDRLRTLMTQRFLTESAATWESVLQQAGVPVTVVRTADEWLHFPTARAGGNVDEIADPLFGAVLQPGRYISIEGPEVASGPLQPRKPQERVEWASARIASPAVTSRGQPSKILDGVRVLDLANVIAGPAAARVLAEFGADVTRIDAPSPQAGPRMTMWFGIDVNQGKRAVILDLKSAEGRSVFERMVKDADVVLHNFLDRSAVNLGITDEELRRVNPDIVSCQISAWGGPQGGAFKDFPAFDPVLQAATGITARYGSPQAPVLHGIASCVDYITGFSAALGVVQALVARKLGRGGSYVRTSLSMGAQMVQFPFLVANAGAEAKPEPSSQRALGYCANYRLYKAKDKWVFLACRATDLEAAARLLSADGPTENDMIKAVANLDAAAVSAALRPLRSASAVSVTRLDELRQASLKTDTSMRGSNVAALAMREADHPSGYRVSLPLPTWYRLDDVAIEALSPAPWPGTDTRAALQTAGFDDSEVQALIARNVARENWAVLKHYLPR